MCALFGDLQQFDIAGLIAFIDLIKIDDHAACEIRDPPKRTVNEIDDLKFSFPSSSVSSL